MKITEVALAAAMLMGTADAFWRMECRGRSALARIDPLVNPGDFSAHAHTVAGSSGKNHIDFALTMRIKAKRRQPTAISTAKQQG